MATEKLEAKAYAVADFGPFKEIPLGPLIVLALLAALSFATGLMFPNVVANVGLLF